MKPLFSLLAILILSTSYGAEKRAFEISDLYALKYPADPNISPDGRSIAFCMTEYDMKEGAANANIWIINADGNNLRQLTQSESSDTRPRWSPDGNTLMFLSNRNQGNQIWLLPVKGGEPTRLTNISTGISDPIWTPDGGHIIFASNVFPEYGAADTLNKQDAESMKKGPVRAYMADKLLYRHWTAWDAGRKTHTLLIDIETREIRDLTPGEHDAPRFSLGGHGYDVSPDSESLCVVSNHDPDPWSSTNADLWITRIEGGELVNITDENEAFDGHPRFAPDGKQIAYLTQRIPRYEADRFRLALYDRHTGAHRILTENFDNWVKDFKWSPDSKSIYFTADVTGCVPLYKVDLKSGKIREILKAGTIDHFEIAPNGKWITLVRRSVGEPAALYRVRTDGQNLTRLEFFNRTIEASVDIRPAEDLWIPAGNGRRIHTFLIKPHGFDPELQYPLILNVHGGPQSQWADAFRGDWQVYPGKGYVVAMPNPTGSTGYGQAFTSAISKDWGGKVYEDVMAVADSLEKLPYVDPERMGAMGWSYGGYMMMWFQGHTDRFKAIASMMGVYDLKSMYGATEELWFPEWDLGGQPWNSDLYEKWSPSNYVENFKTPCLVITGEQDYRVPYTQSLHFFTDLQKMGVESRLIVFPEDGHWPSFVRSMPLYYNAHLDWFHKYLGGRPAPYDMQKILRNRHLDSPMDGGMGADR